MMTLFVGGVHAVGKTFVLKPVCERLGLRHATASQLIKEQRGLSTWTVSRQVDEINENQRALVAAIMRLKLEDSKIVLDGHFVLRRAIKVHEKVGVDTFSQLMLKGVVLLEAPTAVIAERLQQRGDTSWEPSEIELFAQAETENAENICRRLGIPLVKLFVPSEVEVREVVESFMV
jgi:adenylate kinase